MMNRLENGKELESNNVHQEGISLKASSTKLLTTQDVHFVASSAGNVNKVDVENTEQSYLINCPDKNGITTVSGYILEIGHITTEIVVFYLYNVLAVP